jgi:phage protein U
MMLQLGDFQFSIATAAYQELRRSAEYRWASQERIGATDALQFTGFGAEGIEMRGVIYPFHRGGMGQVDALRAAAEAGQPLQLVSGEGRVLGDWVILGINETQGLFARGGIPQKVEFDLRLRRYEGGQRAL